MPYVIRKICNKGVFFAKTSYAQRSGVWAPTGAVAWVISVEAATQFTVRHAAEGVMGALPFVKGETICTLEI